jgi:hypothetical protein
VVEVPCDGTGVPDDLDEAADLAALEAAAGVAERRSVE